jgi:hypothetical protein
VDAAAGRARAARACRGASAGASDLDAGLETRAGLPAFHEIQPDQYRINPDRRWRVFFFEGLRRRSQRNQRQWER